MLGRDTSKHIASANKPPILTETVDKLTLKIKVIMFDIICYPTKLLKASDFNIESTDVQIENPILAVWISSGLNANSEARYPNLPAFPSVGRDNVPAYRDTWTAGKGLSEIDGYDREADFTTYWFRLLGMQSEAEDHVTETDIEKAFRAKAANGSWERYRAAVSEVCHNRKFFMTEKG